MKRSTTENFKLLVLIAGIIFLTASCKKNDITVSGPDFEDVKNFNVQEVDFKYFTSRARVNYESADQNQKVTANIRINKDSAIWMSVTALMGIEAGRIMFTEDSVYVLDRLNKTYMSRDYSWFRDRYNVPLTYDIIQGLLLGNLPLERQPGNKLHKEKQEGFIILEQFLDRIMLESFVKKENMKVSKIQLTEQGTENTVTVDYSDFQALDEQNLFPMKNAIDAKVGDREEDEVKIEIEHSKPEFLDDLDFEFKIPIPGKYEVR